MAQGLLILTLDRPERRNALSREMAEQLLAALESAASDSAVRAVLLRGAGGHFCVGGDVKAMAARSGQPVDVQTRARDLRRRTEAVRWLRDMPKPTVACVTGSAAGAGLALALACDFRFIADNATLTTAFARIGVSGDYGCSYLLTQLAGTARARELMMLSPRLSGEDAGRYGLATQVLPATQVEQAAQQFAARLAGGPTVALGAIKANLNLALDAGMPECLDAEAPRHLECFKTQDHKESVLAFTQKREPLLSGR
jgi:2-(1,2-epoxy-1,2-dihydrophenyl)acetyl-CoA isomerase